MIRLGSILIGAVFVLALVVAALTPREEPLPNPNAKWHEKPIASVGWNHQGLFGTYDRGQLQRGFQVYKEVCSSCHGLRHLSFRNLEKVGFSSAEVKAIAKGYEVPVLNDVGEEVTRPAIPNDHIPGPYANDAQARAANNNALPPDLSLITKARKGGEAYIYSLLVGYAEKPSADYDIANGLYFNPYFSDLNIAMAPPLIDDQLTYGDGTKASVEQMAQDVVAFLAWAADPKLEERRKLGLSVLIFLIVFTGFAYATYRRVWANIKK